MLQRAYFICRVNNQDDIPIFCLHLNRSPSMTLTSMVSLFCWPTWFVTMHVYCPVLSIDTLVKVSLLKKYFDVLLFLYPTLSWVCLCSGSDWKEFTSKTLLFWRHTPLTFLSQFIWATCPTSMVTLQNRSKSSPTLISLGTTVLIHRFSPHTISSSGFMGIVTSFRAATLGRKRSLSTSSANPQIWWTNFLICKYQLFICTGHVF